MRCKYNRTEMAKIKDIVKAMQEFYRTCGSMAAAVERQLRQTYGNGGSTVL
jgi:hypothetical protein